MNTRITLAALLIGSALNINLAADAITSPAATPAPTAPAPTALVDSTAINNEISTLIGNQALASTLEKISFSASVDYESEFIFRGKKLANSVICPELDAAYDIGAGFSPYIGWWGCYSAENSRGSYQENDLYAGLTYEIESFTIDFGYTAYTYADDWKNEHELKLVLSYDTSEYLGDFAVNPYLAGYYNLTYSGTTLEFGLNYSAPISKWLINESWFSMDFALFGGWADYSEGMSDHGGYMYMGFSVDGVVAITDNWSISTGFRYAGQNDNDGTPDNSVWFGAATSIGF